MSKYIVFKVSLDGNTHRFSLEKEGLTMEKLNETLVSIFGKAALRYNLKYEDNDGDIITLKSDFDLKEAINVFSDSKKIVIRLQLTPRTPRKICRRPFIKDEEENGKYSSSDEGNQSNDEINNNDKFDEFKKFGEKFEAYFKEFVENVNNGDAKNWIESFPHKRFFKKFLRHGMFHPFFHNIMKQQASDDSNEKTETENEPSTDKKERMNFFRRCCGRARWGAVDIGVSQVGTKTWKIKNNLPYAWPAGSTLTYFGGDKFTCEKGFTLERDLLPQEEIEVELTFVAPSTPGRYLSFYRFTTPENVPIGRRLRLLLNVKEIEELNKEEQPPQEEVCIVEDVNVESNNQSVEQEQQPQTAEQPQQQEEKGPYSDLIKQLNDMGFTDDPLSLRLLEKYGGDLMAAVDKLLSWQYITRF